MVLIAILYATISTAKLWFADYDPYRTVLSLLQRISLIKVWRNAATCVDSKLCDRACPTRPSVSRSALSRMP